MMNTANENALIGMDGRPCFGIYPGPLTSLNLEDFRPYGEKEAASSSQKRILKYRIKRWEYLGVCNNDIIFGIAIVHLGYMCNLFAYLFDRRSVRISEYEIVMPGGGAAIFDGTSLAGEITFRSGKTSVCITSDSETISIEGAIKGELFVNLSFRKYEEPIVCLTRAGLKGFNYTHKEAGIPVRGTIRHKGMLRNIQEAQSFGVRDYTVGYLARHTFWNWASGGGMDRSGNRIGFNLVQGVNETGFTENAFWVNGRAVKTDVVNFRYDDLNLMNSWYIESNDGRVRLHFMPEGKRSANIHAGIIVSRFHQPFGRFEGILRNGDLDCELQNVFGFTEEHYARW
jgi:hypothetical protein